MSVQTFNVIQKISPVAKFTFLLILFVITCIAGIISLLEAIHFFQFLLSDDAPQVVSQAIQQLRANPTLENTKILGAELWGLSSLSNVSHYVDSRLLEQGLYYASMPKTNQALLFVHVVLGGFCMLLGALQFWPSFRKRYMTIHRKIGTVYIATAPFSVVMAMIYLVKTAPHHLYDHLIAWIALWIFGAFALLSIFMAIRAIRNKKIYEHQAWMALSFSSLLVAPLLRWDWALLVSLFPHIDQETLNLVTMGMMLPQTLLIGYILVVINRQFNRPMSQRKPESFALRISNIFLVLSPLWYAVAIGSTVIVGLYFSIGGLSGLKFAHTLIPHELIIREEQVISDLGFRKWLLVLTNGAALILGIYTLQALLKATAKTLSKPVHLFGKTAAIFALIAGGLAISVGSQIGLQPDRVLLAGGTMYIINGAFLVLFSMIFLVAQYRQQFAIMKESMVFLICMLPYLSSYVLTLWVLQFIHLPTDYVIAGQGFAVPIGFSTGLLFVAFLYVVYGQATREHN
ncbi:DUF2306 domain-containing protein [Acinetobacter sp. AYS6]|uniref:DUF2306 domain-containing protein n=1 Tax=Acinetobacter sp. AYS6 TaxID=2983297 RepID=UPI0021D69364|nr:DUF2306 domain-containing protein [Acinetobacter sp. AYS6]MCU7696968.1 DUF2306 domain-containing protein [Acinetobacter sp. AYS6]